MLEKKANEKAPIILFSRERRGNRLPQVPQYQTEGASGLDICAFISSPLLLEPNKRIKVPTGLAFAIPKGLEMQVRSRSGLADKHGIVVLNSPGTIDSDYRGWVFILLVHLGEEPFWIQPNMRIAQIIFSSVTHIKWEEGTVLPKTERGIGGCGHTGI